MKYRIPNIEGWMSNKEMMFLYNTALEMGSVIELGSWQGRSTHAIASGCSGLVYAIDHWKGSSDSVTEEMAKENDIFSIFKNNIKGFNNIVIVNKDINEAIDDIPNVDMVFIDAAHDFDSVKRDIETWMPKAKKVICGHDYSDNWPGVKKAVDLLVGDIELVGSIWYKLIK